MNKFFIFIWCFTMPLNSNLIYGRVFLLMQGNEEEILNSADKPEISKHRTIMTFINLCSWYTLMIWKWALATERKLPQKIEKKRLCSVLTPNVEYYRFEDVALGNSLYTIHILLLSIPRKYIKSYRNMNENRKYTMLRYFKKT